MPVKRVLISVDGRLLERIDAAAELVGMSRSGYLAQVATADLEGAAGPGASPTVHAALGAIDELLVRKRSG